MAHIQRSASVTPAAWLSVTGVGVACGLMTALIWSTWAIATRHAVTSSLGPGDVTFLRFAVSGLLLLPVLWLGRHQLRGVRPLLLLAMVTGAGAPFMLSTSTGMQFAPASHVATLMIGTMPVFVAILSSTLYGQHLSRTQVYGMVLVLMGIVFIGGHSVVFNRQAGEWRGDALFLFAGFLFAAYTVAQRNSGVSPWVATALVNVVSAAVFTPVYLLWMTPKLAQAPVQEVITQVAAQGIAVSILALWLFSEAVKRLGATRAAVIGALCPALTAVLGIFLIREIPSIATLAGVTAVMLGVLTVVFNQPRT